MTFDTRTLILTGIVDLAICLLSWRYIIVPTIRKIVRQEMGK